MTKKERILEILSRKEAATPIGDALLNAAKKTEAFARSRPGVGTVAGSVGGGLLGALLSKGSRKKRLRNILLGMGIGGAGGYAAGRYMPPLTGAGKEEYDPVVDGANPTITGQQEPAKDNSRREEKVAPQKAQQKAPALTERQKAGQRVSEALAKQGRRQALTEGMKEFGTQLTATGGYDELLGTVGGAIADTAVKAKDAVVGGARDIGRGVVDLGGLAADAMKEKRDVAMGKKLPADVQAEYDRLLKGRSEERRERNRLLREQAAQQAAQQKEFDRIKKKFSPEAQMTYARQPTLAESIERNRLLREQAAQQAARQEAARQEAAQQQAARQEAAQLEAEQWEAEQQAAQWEAEQQEAERKRAAQLEALREAARQEAAWWAARQEAEQQEAEQLEAERQGYGRQLSGHPFTEGPYQQ